MIAAIAVIAVASTYAAYRINAAKLDAERIALQSSRSTDHDAADAMPAVLAALEPRPIEPDPWVAVESPIAAADPEPSIAASTRRSDVLIPATRGAGVHQQPVPERPAAARATLRKSQKLAGARVGGAVANVAEAPRPDPWQAMRVSLTRCEGDLFARIVCEHRVRRHYCEGRWGETPECGPVVANEHGQ